MFGNFHKVVYQAVFRTLVESPAFNRLALRIHRTLTMSKGDEPMYKDLRDEAGQNATPSSGSNASVGGTHEWASIMEKEVARTKRDFARMFGSGKQQ